MKSNESMEDYLETILLLGKSMPVVRSIDVATEMGFKKSSVSVAMKKLRELEYIVVSDAGYITLTKSGKKMAEAVYERHQIITDLLIALGVKKSIAAEDACRIEHVISKQSFNALKKLYQNM